MKLGASPSSPGEEKIPLLSCLSETQEDEFNTPDQHTNHYLACMGGIWEIVLPNERSMEVVCNDCQPSIGTKRMFTPRCGSLTDPTSINFASKCGEISIIAVTVLPIRQQVQGPLEQKVTIVHRFERGAWGRVPCRFDAGLRSYGHHNRDLTDPFLACKATAANANVTRT